VRQIDPWSYLHDVLTRLPSMTNQQYDEIMPETWAKARRAIEKPARPVPAAKPTVAAAA
jgi:hypothetical protein